MFSGLSSNGVFIMLGACCFFSAFDSLNKYLVGWFTPGEIAFVRFGFGALIMLPSLIRQRSWLDKRGFFFLTLRGLLGVVSFYSLIQAFRASALSVTMVLFYTNPMWALLLGALFLGERITWKRSVSAGVAFAGIVVVLNPWEGGIAFGHLYALLAGLLVGAGAVLVTHLRTHHDARVIYAFQCFVGALVTVPFTLGNMGVPELREGLLLLTSAAFGLLAQVTMNYGFRFIRAAEGSTLIMTEAIMTATVGIILFQEPLTVRLVAGAIMIILSGIYLGLRANEGGRDVRGTVAG